LEKFEIEIFVLTICFLRFWKVHIRGWRTFLLCPTFTQILENIVVIVSSMEGHLVGAALITMAKAIHLMPKDFNNMNHIISV